MIVDFGDNPKTSHVSKVHFIQTVLQTANQKYVWCTVRVCYLLLFCLFQIKHKHQSCSFHIHAIVHLIICVLSRVGPGQSSLPLIHALLHLLLYFLVNCTSPFFPSVTCFIYIAAFPTLPILPEQSHSVSRPDFGCQRDGCCDQIIIPAMVVIVTGTIRSHKHRRYAAKPARCPAKPHR